MAIKAKAVEKLQTVGTYAGTYRYVIGAELYNKLSTSKVITEAALRSGISKGIMQTAWQAIGDVVSAWATEGHSVAIPGLGTMRFGVRATSVEDVSKVSTDLITSRRVIFTPNSDIKQELKNTSISITCYDRNGNVVKTVQSADSGDVEDGEEAKENTSSGTASATDSSSSTGGGSTTSGDGGVE